MDALGNDQPDDPRNAAPGVNEIALKAGEQEKDHENVIEDGDEDEDEDLDFNPFLKGTPSPEASSSLSSEVDGLEGGNLSNAAVEVRDYVVRDSEHGEEVVMQTAVSSETGKRLKNPVHKKSKKRKSDSASQMVNENVQLKDIGLNIPIINVDEEEDDDAIWKRTRARYSLASFTLDELETFLQETDDEEVLQNVDDEEEYRKFLAAVLQGGDGNDLSTQDNGNADDEDEDNDADFELELEELLESDGDDTVRDNEKREHEKAGRRPETRQNRRRKVSAQYNKKLLEQSKRPLRPLLPIFPNGGVASFSMIDRKTVTPDNAPSQLCSAAEDGLINGFTPQQIGQLHCLIHEHVQLLIQVYSLCILDSSRQQVASQVQGLISEMLCKRDEVMASRRMLFPANCFHPLYMCPSVVDELPHFSPAQHTFGSSSSINTRTSVSQNTSPSEGRETAFNRRIDSSRTASSFWLPCIRGPVVSILDVAPLNLAGRYMEDVHNAVREYRRGHLDSNCETRYAREPLFHHPYLQSMADANGEVLRRNMNIPDTPNAAPFVPSQKPFKKTLAASIVERAKKQPVALVPKDISKLAQSFLPLFNPALFPHKPPPASVASRILFTDAEDELLALGMMEYNTNWKAIQQRFLPCKSKHQIFVRQKNRCSSKAPDNPIKAVRKMKTSPLTAEEIEDIQEGLNVFKLDWMSVWKHVVPHRDPSLLRRQWRIALGTQRSYKQDAAKKEKRRLYESNRRKKKTGDLADWETSSGKEDNQVDSAGGENNSGDDSVDNANEAYVHQAFLSDWRPGASTLFSSNHRGKNLSSVTLSKEGFNIREQPNDNGHGEAQNSTNSIHGFPYPSHCYQFPHSMTLNCPSSSSEPTLQISDVTLNSSKSNACLGPSRTCGTDGTQLVRLAPQLPPVNLPPSVRVISQSAFKNSRCGVSLKVSASGGNTGDAGKESAVRQPPHAIDSRTTDSINTRRNESDQEITNVSNSCPEEFTNSRPEGFPLVNDACAVGEKGGDLDLQMHPLLFQAPEDGCLPYYSLSCSNETSSSLSFFSGKQPQLNLSLFHNPHQANHVVGGFSKSSKTKESCSASCGIDFHPLLQMADEENGDLATACSDTHRIASSGGKAAFQNSFGSSQIGSGCQSSSANEKGNELDLEIHLSNTSVKEKTGGSEDVNAKNMSISAVKVPNSGNKVETQKFSSPCHQQSENLPAVPSSFVSAANGSTGPTTNVSACNMDDTGDQSHPGIVMEQEELSDSDDEIEEHVEFECEEMADSDGEEGSGCEATAQEVPSSLAERVTAGTDDGGKICESRSAVCPQGNASSPKKDGPLFLKLSLGKEPTSGSWLSLDSCAPVDSSGSKGKTAVEGGTVKAAGRPNRSTKKTTPRTKKMRKLKDVTDMAQQLSLGPLSVSTLKKPRKRTSRTNTNLSIGMTP